MPLDNQTLGCKKGDSYVFEIDMQPNPDNTQPDLTGATATWKLAESWFPSAQIYVTKSLGSGLFIAQESGVWKIVVSLDPADTAGSNVPYGVLYHEARVLLTDGTVSHVANGPFELSPTV